jgi:uncharacterized OB-fold protein
MIEVVESPTLPAPSPAVSADTREFWEATREGRFLIRRCHSCGEAIWYPRPICPFCHSTDTGWEEGTGKGTIYTFAIVRRGGGVYREAPYALAYVELAEGPRMMTNIVDCDFDAIEIGLAVELVFHRTEEGTALPRFRLRT